MRHKEEINTREYTQLPHPAHRQTSTTGTPSTPLNSLNLSNLAPNTSPSKKSSCGLNELLTNPASIKFSNILKTYVPQFHPRPRVSYPF
ncbi:hypothetical protein PILCRDRAFT_822309 [Piloderma croceum F 1598]|uniref:Uncharacterized protein n=1 Tax=Piloderma croceum (strain F 1598) TaxID=765440 RepID=A0A0C3BTB1_PILCF|nr:hypothetical protein PILCRDRAFT_822309 [Piloderma croceum F 1598]